MNKEKEAVSSSEIRKEEASAAAAAALERAKQIELADRKRRDIVKNVAIVFLAAMLVLTFFSNTIMNMSLPEVTTQVAAPGNVSEQVRRSSSLTVAKSYDVIVDETRKVAEVMVKEGQAVQKGDVIYKLEGKESTELETAEKTLDSLEIEYKKMLLDAEVDDSYILELMEITNAHKDISEMEHDLAVFDTDEYKKEKYVTDMMKIEGLKDNISEIEKTLAELPQTTKSAEALGTELSGYEEALACLGTDDFSPLPDEWYKKLTAASDKVTKADEALAEAKEKYEAAGNGGGTYSAQKTKIEGYIAALETEDMLGLPTEYYNRVSGALEERDAAKEAYEEKKEAYELLQAEIGDTSSYTDQIRAKNRELQAKTTEYNDVMNKIAWTDGSEGIDELFSQANALAIEIQTLNDELSELISKENTGSAAANKLKTSYNAYSKAQKKYKEAEKKLLNIKKQIKKELIAELNQIKDNIEKYEGSDALEALKKDVDDKTKAKKAADKNLEDVKKSAKEYFNEKIRTVKKQKECIEKKEDYQAQLKTAEAEFSIKLAEDRNSLEDKIEQSKRDIAVKEATLSKTKITDNITDRKAALDIEAKAKEIESQKKSIEEMRAKSMGGEVIAPVSGTVRSLSCSAGESTTAGNAAAVIDMVDKGYLLSFTVTTEQAKKFRVGTEAEVAENQFGAGDITATLSAIKTDTSNPQSSKILEFAVTGSEIKPGDSITVTIGAKGQQYPVVVPNSCIRSDSNGKYVLVVEPKSTATGSRYYAVRYSVDVLAQSDRQTAINGLNGNEFIISTSSAPLKEGQQVKLADGENV